MPSIKPTVRIASLLTSKMIWFHDGHYHSHPVELLKCYVTQALRFYGSFNATVTGITIQNSPQCHLKFDNCVGVLVHDISVSSPGDSLNTDGIHLQNSKDVLIHSTSLSCGNYVTSNHLILLLNIIYLNG